jgi:cyclase
MLRQRVIPVLLLNGRSLVKTQKFRQPKYIGDPVNAIRIFNDKEVDEIIFLDISASKTGAAPNFDLIKIIASECFMPLTYGGGIAKVEHASRLFEIGAEKVCIQTAALSSPSLVTQIAMRYGSQSVVVSIDIKHDWFGKPRLYKSAVGGLRKDHWIEMIKVLVEAGAGEVVLNSVDRDGTLKGPDLSLIRTAANAIQVPLIALGGVASLADIRAAVDAGASAVAAGSYFVFHGPHKAVLLTYPNSSELENLFK